MDMKCLKNLGVLLKEQTPHILTGTAVVGVVMTGISAAKAAPKAKEHLEKLENPTLTDKAKAVIPIFAPTFLVGAATIGCILGADHVNAKRYAALAGTYAVVKNQFDAHKDKITELFGADGAKKVEREIAKDDLVNKANEKTLVYMDEHQVLCKDSVIGLTFKSTMLDIQVAVNEINRQLAMDPYATATLADFYSWLDGELYERVPSIAEDIVWGNNYKCPTMDVCFDAEFGKDGKPFLTFSYDYCLR